MKNQKNKKEQEHSYTFKYILIGDSSVGKSCLLLQLLDHRYRMKHEPTIGVEFGAKTLTICEKPIKLQIWDTAGQESFRSITRGYYRSAAAAILIYDISNRASFKNLQRWLSEATTNGNKQLTFFLIGNKSDLEIDRKVSFEEGSKFAEEHGMNFMEASARSGENVNSCFVKLSEDLLEKIEDGRINVEECPIGIKVGSGSKRQEMQMQKYNLQESKSSSLSKIANCCH